MPIKYQFSKHATVNDEESLTEQEHKDSCDINLMLKAAQRGQMFRTSAVGQYGHEDMNMTQLQMRITKQQIEEEFENLPKDHFSEEDLKKIPLALIKKHGFVPKQEEKREKSKNAIKPPKTKEPIVPTTTPATPSPEGDPESNTDE